MDPYDRYKLAYPPEWDEPDEEPEEPDPYGDYIDQQYTYNS